MNGVPAVSPLVRKEARALLPTWLAVLGTVSLTGLAGQSVLASIGIAVYGVGAITLGAMSVGHEYEHGTLPALLTIPRDRRRILATKAAVLACALATLVAGSAGILELAASGNELWEAVFSTPVARTLLLLPVVAGLTVAPWLTMACRSQIGGVVFTMVIPAALLALGRAVAGRNAPDTAAGLLQTLSIVWTGTAASAAIGAVLGCRTFLRLEALGGGGELDTAAWTGRATAESASSRAPHGTRRPFLLLLQKELRLQSVTFIVAALYVLGWLLMWLTARESGADVGMIGAMTFLFSSLVPALIGALASAEERAFGTLAWQVLQPYPMWKQWAIKLAVLLTLAMLLTLGLPAALESVLGTGDQPFHPYRIPRWSGGIVQSLLTSAVSILLVAAVAVCGAFVSTLSTGGLRALLLSFPFIAVIAAASMAIAAALEAALFSTLEIQRLFRDLIGVAEGASRFRTIALWSQAGPIMPATRAGLLLGFCVLLIRFGLRNHGMTERGQGVRQQFVWIALYVIVASAIAGGMRPLAMWTLAR